jgi:hypothetical protein
MGLLSQRLSEGDTVPRGWAARQKLPITGGIPQARLVENPLWRHGGGMEGGLDKDRSLYLFLVCPGNGWVILGRRYERGRNRFLRFQFQPVLAQRHRHDSKYWLSNPEYRVRLKLYGEPHSVSGRPPTRWSSDRCSFINGFGGNCNSSGLRVCAEHSSTPPTRLRMPILRTNCRRRGVRMNRILARKDGAARESPAPVSQDDLTNYTPARHGRRRRDLRSRLVSAP